MIINGILISQKCSHQKAKLYEPLIEPSDFQVKKISDYAIELSWQNRAPTAWSFQIERKANTDAFQKIGDAAVGATTWKDETVIIGNSYQYRIKAKTGKEESNYALSNTIIVDGIPLSAPTDLIAMVTPQCVELQWKNADNRIEFFRVYRSEGQSATTIFLKPTMRCVFVDKEIVEAATYTYYVIAVYKANLSTPVKMNVTTSPKAPSNIDAEISADKTIKLMWQNNSVRVEEFEIQRAPVSSGDFTVIAYTRDNHFIDDNKQSWRYRVRGYLCAQGIRFFSPFIEFKCILP